MIAEVNDFAEIPTRIQAAHDDVKLFNNLVSIDGDIEFVISLWDIQILSVHLRIE